MTDFAPDAVAHFGVYEPDSRMGPRDAAQATEACTVHTLGAAARTGKLTRIALRSGLDVYGRGRGRPLMPDEYAPLAPTTPYGQTCFEVEAVAAGIARRNDVSVAALRYAVVAGSHVPEPARSTPAACPPCRFLRSPTHPSLSCTRTTRRGQWSRRSCAGMTAR